MRALLIALLLAIAGCWGGGGGSSSSSPPPPVDTTAPVISLVGADPQFVEAGTAYTEFGATAVDDKDGNLTDSIFIDASTVDTSVPGDYAVHYEVSDAAGNTGVADRTVIVQDTTPPVITLLGEDLQIMLAGTAYVELGASATDSLDGDLTGSIVVDATAVNTTATGNYPVTYDVVDRAGNGAVTKTRTVRVLVTGEWHQTGSMFNERAPAGAVLLNDGRVLVVGGEYARQPFPNQAEIYNPSTEEFTLAGEAPSGVPVVLLDGRVLIAVAGSGDAAEPSSIYDPVTGVFRAVEPMNGARRNFSVTLLHDGRVLIAGGINWSPDCEILDSAEIFDPVTETFALTGRMSIPRTGHTATLLDDGTVLVVGGRSTELCSPDFTPPEPTLRSAELFDPATGTFSATGEMPDSGVLLNSATMLPDGNVLVVVGTEGWEGQKNTIYDVGSRSFLHAGDMESFRADHAAVALKSSEACEGPIMVAGGSQGPTGSLNSVELYDTALGNFYSTRDLPEARAGGHTATLLNDGRVLVTGGFYFENGDQVVPLRTASIFEPVGGCP